MSIEKRLAERLQAKPQELEPWRYSQCHGREMVSAPVVLLQTDGSTRRIGRMRYCLFAGMEGRDWKDCRRPHAVIKGRDWPKNLPVDDALRVCNHAGPEFWLESAFHVFMWEGKWTTLRAYTKAGFVLPPFLNEPPRLCPQARRLAGIIKRAGSGGGWGNAIAAFSLKGMPRRDNPGITKREAAEAVRTMTDTDAETLRAASALLPATQTDEKLPAIDVADVFEVGGGQDEDVPF